MSQPLKYRVVLAAIGTLVFVSVANGHEDHENPLIDIAEYSFTPVDDLATPRSDMTATTLGNSIYLIGGCGQFDTNDVCQQVSDEILAYNPRSDSFRNTGVKLLTGRYGHSVANFDGTLYIFGGKNTAGIVPTVEVLDTRGDSPQIKSLDAGAYQVSTSDGAAFALEDFVVYCGGFDQNEAPTADCMVIEPANSDALQPSTLKLTQARGGFQVVVIDDVAYAVGGYGVDQNGSEVALASTETLDDADQFDDLAWNVLDVEEIPGLARGSKSVVAFEDHVYVFGGTSKSAGTPSVDTTLNSVLRFDPEEEDAEGEAGVWEDVAETPTRATGVAGEFCELLGTSREGVILNIAASFGEEYVFLFGGKRKTATGSTEVLDTVFRFHESEDIFEHPTIPLHGSGTTNPSRFFRKWMDILSSRSKIPLRLTYRAVGSSTGQSDFKVFPPVVDFACGDIPVPKETYENISVRDGHQILHIPFALGTISVFANIPGFAGNIKLSGCNLAAVYTEEISKWSDQRILDDNPGLEEAIGSMDATILVGRRNKGSSSTFGISQYMATACEGIWGPTFGAKIPQVQGENVRVVEGSSGMTKFLLTTPFSIGYLDSGHGIDNGLAEVALEVDEGEGKKEFYVSNDAKIDKGAAAEGVEFPDPTADWSDVSLQNQPFPAWPITMVSYFYVYKDQRGKGLRGSLLEAFLRFVFDLEAGGEKAEGQKDLAAFGFVPLPDNMLNISQTTVGLMRLSPDVSRFEFETDTRADGEGMGDYVISSKRNPKPIDLAETASVTARLTEENDQLQAIVAQLQAQVSEYETVRGIAIAALVIAFFAQLGLIVGFGFYLPMRSQAPCAKETEMRYNYDGGENGKPKEFTENVSRT